MENIFNPPSAQNLKEAIKSICRRIAEDTIPSNKELIKICAEQNVGFIENDPHLVHEILETAVNLHLTKIFEGSSLYDKAKALSELGILTQKLPPQSWRSNEQTNFQQFSTPPTIGFVMGELLKPEKGKTGLEPSAGTGSLAVWLKIAGCQTEVNEISERRRQLLELQGYNAHQVNAEFLHDLLPPKIKPDYILMNPPFSASAGRTKTRNSNFGFRHIEAALMRLENGGRLVALLGSEACLKTDKGKVFCHRIAQEYKIQAFLKLPQKAYYKFGTSISTTIICISKAASQTRENRNEFEQQIKFVECDGLSDALAFADAFNKTEC